MLVYKNSKKKKKWGWGVGGVGGGGRAAASIKTKNCLTTKKKTTSHKAPGKQEASSGPRGNRSHDEVSIGLKERYTDKKGKVRHCRFGRRRGSRSFQLENDQE